MTDLTTYSEEPISDKTSFLSRPLIAALNVDWEKVIYLLFIVIAIVSRFWGVGDRAMSHDESLHTQFSYQFYRGDGFSHTPLMHGPFLFHATALSYWLFGHSDYTARIPAAFLGVLLVALPYLLRPYLGRVGSLFTSFVFLISPYLLYYSRYIREDIFAIIGYLLLFVFMWYYIDRREEKYLYYFAAALSFLFTTKEISFFYVAIFGSFLVLRLLPQLVTSEWFATQWRALLRPFFVLIFGAVLLGSGFIGYSVTKASAPDFSSSEVVEAELIDETAVADSGTNILFRWLAVTGTVVAALGLFLAGNALRPYINHYPEFDLIILFATLILPFIAPVFMVIVGWDPTDYHAGSCLVPGEETMSAWSQFVARLFSGNWWGCVLQSGLMRIFYFLGGSLLIGNLVGLWWNRRRWLITAVVFYSIFLIFYTSVFTNFGGIVTGMSGSLGYWLEQQEVQRGSQPWFYYFVVMPFYEYLSVIFSLVAIGYWLKKERLNKIVGYWVAVLLVATFAYTLINWFVNSTADPLADPRTLPGLIAAISLLVLGLIFWFAFVARRLRASYELEGSLWRLWRWPSLIGLVPFLTWWLLLTWAAFSYAGEKMPWLSTHFVIPMALLIGWYFNEKLRPFDWRDFCNKTSAQLLLLSTVLIVAVLMTVGPVLLGEIQFGSQESANLTSLGQLVGSLLLVGLLLYLWLNVRERLADGRVRRLIYTLSLFGLLSFLTARTAYVASFPNADYVREFLVYAHGAPAIKNIILDQVEELSQRLYGDNSIKVAYGGDGVPWPFTWYMRQYPNNTYFAESPTASLQDAPVIIVGGSSWAQLDSVLGGSHSYTEYTYMWWPMEDYRQINWNAILGDPNTPEGIARRGLLNADVRQAIWDIWFHRDYEKYDQVFGKNHTDGQWPLRDGLRLYIRNDVVGQLWDRGMVPTNTAVGPTEIPFADNQFTVEPTLVLHAAGFPGAGEGEFLAPRDVAVAPDGTLFVLDSGNQRVQRFAADGTFIDSWGEPGMGPGQFSADGQGPWGIAVDDAHVYVADTWNHRIQKFTHDGQLVGMFGGAGNIAEMNDAGLGFFFGPRDIAVLADGRLLITDTGNHRVQIMDAEGNFVDQIGGANGLSGAGLGLFYEPVGVTVDPFGFLYVTDTWNGRVQQFMPQLFPVSEWRIDHWAGNASINNKPYLASDSAGRIYVTDPENYRVLIFSSSGEYIGKFGQFGTDINSLALPTGIFIDAEDNIYIADAGNNRVLKYGPLFGPPISLEEPEAPLDEEGLEEPLPSDDALEETGQTDDTEPADEEIGEDGSAELESEGPTATAVDEESELDTDPTPTSEQ